MSQVRTVYGIKHKDEIIRAKSRSGGFFTAVSDKILAENGVIYGVALDENFYALHKRAVNEEERNTFRGLKYVQSDIGDTYVQAKNDLENGKKVLFSGTPCQIHGLLNYLKLKNADASNLLTLEILCHGAPSPRIWHDFLETNYDINKIVGVDFRDKKNFGWRDHVETITLDDGTEKSSRIYTGLFYSHVMLRESCFRCPYKKAQRTGDITIGDFWRIENNDKQFDDDKGVSLVLANSDKGKRYLESCKENLILREYPLSTCIQPALDHNYKMPNCRKDFWREYNGKNMIEMYKKYALEPKPTIKVRAIRFTKKAVKKVIKLLAN